MNADVHTLAGPYALDALPDDDREAFDVHLRDCEACREELAEFRATAARLAAAVAVTPPQELRSRVLAAAARTRQVPPPVPVARQPDTRPLLGRRRVLAGAAALVLVAGAGVGGVQIHQLLQAARQREQLAAVIAAPDVRTVRGQVSGGGTVSIALSRREGAAIVVLDGLPEVPPDRTYQLWLMRDGTAQSAGTVDLGGSARTTRVLTTTAVATADGFGLTVEPAGGSPNPTPPVITQLPLPGH